MQMIDGKQVAELVAADLRERIAALDSQGITPTLAIIVVGNDLRTQKYITAKQKAAEQLGIEVKLIALSATSDDIEATIAEQIALLNSDPNVHGIILQLPIPAEVDEQDLIDLIVSQKDVDGLTLTSQAALEAGRELFLPATPQGILRLLSSQKLPIYEKRIAVIGQGKLVGKPLTAMLRSRGADVATADSKIKDLASIVRGASIVISAVGKENLITAEMVDPDMTLIDVGLSDVNGTLRGDIAQAAKEKAQLATPVIGGVGPMTVISLLANVVLAAELAAIRMDNRA